MVFRKSIKIKKGEEEKKNEMVRPSDPQVLLKMYTELLDDLAVPDAIRASMLENQGADQMWRLIEANATMVKEKQLQRRKSRKLKGGDVNTASYWIGVCEAVDSGGRPSMTASQAQEMDIVLKTGHKQFLIDFIQGDGVKSLMQLVEFYSDLTPKEGDEKKIVPLLMSSFKALMNNHVGMEGVLKVDGAVSAMAGAMAINDHRSLTLATEVMLLLAVTCFYSSTGRNMVVRAMDDLRRKWREPSRYATLMATFKKAKSDHEFRAAALMFITTIVNSAASVDSRVAVRNDFLALNAMSVFKKAVKEATAADSEHAQTIATQFQVFEDMMIADRGEVVHSLFSASGLDFDDEDALDLSDQNDVFQHLKISAAAAGTPDLLLTLTQSLVLIPTERVLAAPVWKGITQFVREATSYVVEGNAASKNKASKLNYELLHELLDERLSLDKKLSQLGTTDDIVARQKKKIEELTKAMKDPKKSGSAAKKLQEDVDVLRKQNKEQLAEIANLKKKMFQLQTAMRNAEAKAKEDIAKAAATGGPPALQKRQSMKMASKPAASSKKAAPDTSALMGMLAKNQPASTGSAAPPPAEGASDFSKGEYAKYWRMKKAGLPEGAIINAMNRDDVIPPPGFFGDDSLAAGGNTGGQKKKQEDAGPQKPVIKPSVKMRGIFWTKIANSKIEGTIWPELDDSKIKLDVALLESKFQKAEAKKLTKKKTKDDDKVHIVDGKRQQNVGIGISRFRATNDEIRTAIMKVDETMLSLERAKALLLMSPTDDEITMLQGYDGDLNMLTTEDRFLYEMTTIPRLTNRLKSIVLKHTFDKDALEIKQKIRIVRDGCVEIEQSSDLKKLLEIVLAVGNYVNGSTPRGGAWGFKLDALSKLETVKETGGKNTLVHYVVHVIETHYPGLKKFKVPKSAEAKGVSLKETHSDLRNLSQGLKIVLNEINLEHTEKNDRFVDAMQSFQIKASKQVAELEDEFNTVLTDFERLGERFAESDGNPEPKHLFGKFVDFQGAVMRAIEQIEAARAREEKARKLEEEKRKRRTLKAKREARERGEDDSVFDAFKQANTGDASQIVAGLQARYKVDDDVVVQSRESELGTSAHTKAPAARATPVAAPAPKEEKKDLRAALARRKKK